MIGPGKTIGILGGGQLGRMSILAGRKLGYKFHVFEPRRACSAGMVADREINANYEDEAALLDFASDLHAVTLEFENVPLYAIETVTRKCPVSPTKEILQICQNRSLEKQFLENHGFPCVPFRMVTSSEELRMMVKEIGAPCVLKTAVLGYDGKGQIKIDNASADFEEIWEQFPASQGVLEKWLPLKGECSIICARNKKGRIESFPLAENIHTNHILDYTVAPARFAPEVGRMATAIAQEIAETLKVTGLMSVEFFISKAGELLVNELAPRTHNSGHFSLDACVTSQFEQHVRAVCDLPLGATDLLSPVVMVNLLGELWQSGGPHWEHLLQDPRVKLHLYDKGPAKKGRKMGHFNVLGEEIEEVLDRALRLKKRISPKGIQEK